MAAQRTEVMATAPKGPTTLEAKPLKRKPRKTVASKKGAATTKASHSAQTGRAEAYATLINSGTIGVPRRTVRPSDNALNMMRVPSHTISDLTGTAFNAK